MDRFDEQVTAPDLIAALPMADMRISVKLEEGHRYDPECGCIDCDFGSASGACDDEDPELDAFLAWGK